MSRLSNKYKYIIICMILILIITTVIIVKSNNNEDNIEEISLLETTKKTTKKETHNYIDIKGSVNNPGVYEFKENDRVIDAIEIAGGLTKNANTSNINLSQKLKSEMVIYVYNNEEIKNNTQNLTCDNVCKVETIEVNNCIEVNTNKNNSKTSETVNINTASIEELMTLTGIGESKAKSIIEYRKEKRFEKTEDIMNISGIGESLFNKIKDNISV